MEHKADNRGLTSSSPEQEGEVFVLLDVLRLMARPADVGQEELSNGCAIHTYLVELDTWSKKVVRVENGSRDEGIRLLD